MTPPKKKRAKAQRAEWYRFQIDAFTPETMPMARLAEYLAKLADVVGETQSVHFMRVEGGSTALAYKVEHEAIPKVRDRVQAIKRGDAPRDAQDAYRTINKYLREDNARAVLRERKTGPKILEFPGTEEAEQVFPSVKQAGSISGVLVRIGGTGDQIWVLLESEGQQLPGCHTNRHTAKKLAPYLFEPVRLNGQGYWMRDAEGQWNLKHFRVDSFDPLEDVSLSEALTELRAVVTDWDEEIYEDLEAIRQGRPVDGGD